MPRGVAKKKKKKVENGDISRGGFSSDFVDMIPNAQATVEKKGKLDFITIKNFCVSKDSIRRVKSQPTEWENMFIIHTSDEA